MTATPENVAAIPSFSRAGPKKLTAIATTTYRVALLTRIRYVNEIRYQKLAFMEKDARVRRCDFCTAVVQYINEVAVCWIKQDGDLCKSNQEMSGWLIVDERDAMRTPIPFTTRQSMLGTNDAGLSQNWVISPETKTDSGASTPPR
jgi:hypothetical protein